MPPDVVRGASVPPAGHARPLAGADGAAGRGPEPRRDTQVVQGVPARGLARRHTLLHQVGADGRHSVR